ncbi:hypothetical protein V8C35DRAFT_281964 [Trichoderma chlorosporum]
MPCNKTALDMADLGKSLDEPASKCWPKEWRDCEKDNLAKALAHVHKREAYWDSLGMPCGRVVTRGSHTRLEPRIRPSREAIEMGTAIDTEYVHLTREAVPGQLEKPTTYIMVGNERVGVDYKVVPIAEDNQSVDRPVDVESYDQPAADTDYYLQRGNEFVASVMTENGWRPGQLIGQDGSDPATLAKSPSYASPDRHAEATEPRSATSTGHLLQYERPEGVGLGWGGYDQFTQWQLFGRRVHKDMVEKRDWSTDPLAPIKLVDEHGKVVDTLTIPAKWKDRLPRPRNLVSLYDKLDPADSQQSTAVKEQDAVIVDSGKPQQEPHGPEPNDQNQ